MGENSVVGNFIDEAKNRNKSNADLFESAVRNVLGREALSVIRAVPVELMPPENELCSRERKELPKKRFLYPYRGFLEVRREMGKKGLLSISGYQERFPEIAQFDELTYMLRGPGNKEAISSIDKRMPEEYTINCASYSDDGCWYPRAVLPEQSEESSAIEPNRLEGTYSYLNKNAGRYRPGKNKYANWYVYYYRNELDHLLSYHLLKCVNYDKASKSLQDLGLIAMQEAACKGCISEKTLYEMGFLEAACNKDLQEYEVIEGLRAGFRAERDSAGSR